MKNSRVIYASLALAAACALALAGCGGGEDAAEQARTMPEGHPPTTAEAPATVGVSAEVLETFDSAGYTYLRVRSGEAEQWAAVRETEVEVGEEVVLTNGMLMKDFHSSSLDRTFPEIWFYGSLLRPGEVAVEAAGAAPTTVNPGSEGHPEVVVDAGGVDLSNIQKPAGGMTVAEIHAAKGTLGGKEVLVRGKVVKFTANVMSRNWIHLRDGTGEGDAADLAVTTDATAKVGQTLLVKGVVAEDKDFGYGYEYDILVEQAEITVE